jgi:L-arabinose isomerase
LRAVWKCLPGIETARAEWISAGGAHHIVFSQAVSTERLEDFGAIAGGELVVIDGKTDLRAFQRELGNNDLYDCPAHGLGC